MPGPPGPPFDAPFVGPDIRRQHRLSADLSSDFNWIWMIKLHFYQPVSKGKGNDGLHHTQSYPNCNSVGVGWFDDSQVAFNFWDESITGAASPPQVRGEWSNVCWRYRSLTYRQQGTWWCWFPKGISPILFILFNLSFISVFGGVVKLTAGSGLTTFVPCGSKLPIELINLEVPDRTFFSHLTQAPKSWKFAMLGKWSNHHPSGISGDLHQAPLLPCLLPPSVAFQCDWETKHLVSWRKFARRLEMPYEN